MSCPATMKGYGTGVSVKRPVAVTGRTPVAVGAESSRGGCAARCRGQQHEQGSRRNHNAMDSSGTNVVMFRILCHSDTASRRGTTTEKTQRSAVSRHGE